MLDVDPLTRPLLLDFVPRFRLLVDDLSAAGDEQLRARAMTELGRIVLWLLKTARHTDEMLAGLAGWAELFHKVMAAPNGVAAMGKIWQYVMAVHEGSHERVLPALATALDDEGQRRNMATIAEQLIEKGKKEGLAEGRKEGRKEGKKEGIVEGQRATLVRLLERRFGPLPSGARERIATAGRPDLERWLDKVLAAATLDDVLGGAS